MWLTRTFGINLHPTSLPGGRLGPDAYAFVDWLHAARAHFWQFLPLGPPDEYGSPYSSASAFATWSGLLADPEAAVGRRELRRFERANTFWIRDWMEFAGSDALADQAPIGELRRRRVAASHTEGAKAENGRKYDYFFHLELVSCLLQS